MKNTTHLLALLAVCAMGISLPSCVKDQCEGTVTYAIYEPVYVQPEVFRQPIQAGPARQIENPGKIYVYQNYLFINELRKGIHLIDNSNPAQPQPISFIDIPGNVDMAVRGGMLYADNYVDIVAIDISNPVNPAYAGRSEAALPHHGFDEEKGFIAYYEWQDRTEEVPCDEVANTTFFRRDGGLMVDLASASASESSNQKTDVGVGGSMARFTMAQGYLYVIDESRLHVFDLSTPGQPEKANTVNIGWGIETIFPLDDKLFIGANDGMYIFDNSNPLEPRQLSVFRHAMACDPVFVDGDIAYVTLRGGNECQNFNNQLDVVDVTDLTNPKLIRTFPMHNPHGLSKSGQALYICENTQGVKVFDASDPESVGNRQIGQMEGFQAYDIITLTAYKLAIVIGEDGMYQYDISDPANPVRLSNLLAN